MSCCCCSSDFQGSWIHWTRLYNIVQQTIKPSCETVHFNAFQHDHGNQHEASVHGTAQVRSAKPRSGSAELTWDVVEINGTPFGSFFWGMN